MAGSLEGIANSILQNEGLVKIIIAVGGGIAGAILTRVSKKLATVTYNVNTIKLGQTANNNIHGNIEIRHKDYPLPNFYFSTIVIRNCSNTDLENVTITFFVVNGIMILSDYVRYDDSLTVIPYSPEYQAIAEEGNNTEYFVRREYMIPVLNRGCKIHLELTLTHEPQIVFPRVNGSMSHVGAKLIEAPTSIAFHGVSIHRTLPWAIIIGIALYPILCLFIDNSWIVGSSMLVYGFFAQSITAYIIRGIDFVAEKVGVIPPA